jgi:starch phosphorylase
MEIALSNDVPTYSGGLGVLAGDTLRSAADLGLPMIGVTLLHRTGYFFQRLDDAGRQREEPVIWPVDDLLEPLEARCRVDVEGRTVLVRPWRYQIVGVTGAVVPVLLLDTDLPENDPADRRLTDALYGGDDRYRLCQEAVLGIGGIRMLRALGYTEVSRFHMNEGHAALLALELCAEERARSLTGVQDAIGRVRRLCVFTTHTPVPAGHDQFSLDLARKVLGGERLDTLQALECCDGVLNLTLVGLKLSHYVNGVTDRHGRVSRTLFPGYPIGSITNGVHSPTWTAPAFHALYDRHIPDWRRDSFSLRYALGIPLAAIRDAHRAAKRQLVETVNRGTNAGFDLDVLTLGFARRATAYKRPTLLFRDQERLRRIAAGAGGLQLVFAGKAHPRDTDGKRMIEAIVAAGRVLGPEVRVAYLPNYDLGLGLVLTAGADVWLNTPTPPYEASGTSGMKAAHNGVPSLSVLDGWWLEGHVEGVTGWAVGPRDRGLDTRGQHDDDDARDLYRVLEEAVVPLYRGQPERWTAIMRNVIALNASFFNTQRMLQEYVIQAYRD